MEEETANICINIWLDVYDHMSIETNIFLTKAAIEATSIEDVVGLDGCDLTSSSN